MPTPIESIITKVLDVVNIFKINHVQVTSTAAELNKLDGTTAELADFDKLAAITSSAAELNELDGTSAVLADFDKLAAVTASAAELNINDGIAAGATMVVGTESSNAINVTIQLTDADGADLAAIGHVRAYLSDTVTTGIGISGTAPATSVAIGTDGAIIVEEVTKLAWWLQSEADGDIDLTITETGADTWYLVIVFADGTQAVSDAITFA